VNKKVLICDDNEDILEMTSMMLEASEYIAITESDSTRLINRAIQEKPDVLLLDLWMPFLPGDELALAIRNTPEIAHLPIIIFSAAVNGKEKAVRAKANYFISKPFDMDVLLDTVHTALTK
jgi:CheY-like chemotaxis protein